MEIFQKTKKSHMNSVLGFNLKRELSLRLVFNIEARITI